MLEPKSSGWKKEALSVICNIWEQSLI